MAARSLTIFTLFTPFGFKIDMGYLKTHELNLLYDLEALRCTAICDAKKCVVHVGCALKDLKPTRSRGRLQIMDDLEALAADAKCHYI